MVAKIKGGSPRKGANRQAKGAANANGKAAKQSAKPIQSAASKAKRIGGSAFVGSGIGNG